MKKLLLSTFMFLFVTGTLQAGAIRRSASAVHKPVHYIYLDWPFVQAGRGTAATAKVTTYPARHPKSSASHLKAGARRTWQAIW